MIAIRNAPSDGSLADAVIVASAAERPLLATALEIALAEIPTTADTAGHRDRLYSLMKYL